MRHPFDGINVPAPTGSSRRSWLSAMLASLAGVVGFRAAARAVAPPINVRTVAGPSPEPSTAALLEEGAATRALGENAKDSTEALREEAGRLTTRALREEAATQAVREGGATTLAVGEEGARKATKALNEAGAALPPGKVISSAAKNEEGS